MTIRSVWRRGFSPDAEVEVVSSKGPSIRDNRRMKPTHVCIILTSRGVPFALTDIILVTIAIRAAQSRRGPDLLLQTADIL